MFQGKEADNNGEGVLGARHLKKETFCTSRELSNKSLSQNLFSERI